MGASVGLAWGNNAATLGFVTMTALSEGICLASFDGGLDAALSGLREDATRPDYILIELPWPSHTRDTVTKTGEALAELSALCAPNDARERPRTAILFLGPEIYQDDADAMVAAGLRAYIRHGDKAALSAALAALEVEHHTIDATGLITVIGAAGGVGTSTVAAAIAATAAKRRGAALLIDLDSDTGTQARRFGFDHTWDGLPRLLEDANLDRDTLTAAAVAREANGAGKLAVLSGSVLPETATEAAATGLRRLLLVAQRSYRAVVLDGGHRSVRGADAFAGTLVVVANQTPEALAGTERLWAAADRLACPRRVLVLNMVGRRGPGVAAFAEALGLDPKEIIQIPEDRRRVAAAEGAGQILLASGGRIASRLRRAADFALAGAPAPRKGWLRRLFRR